MSLDAVLPLLYECCLGHHELIALRGASCELRSLASHDDAWTQALQRYTRPLGTDERSIPAYPSRARGRQRDDQSFFPIEAERDALAGFVLPPDSHPWGFMNSPWQTRDEYRVTEEGVLEDAFHPESETALPRMEGLPAPARTRSYKARPLPLRCEECHVTCDSYDSFTAHCTLGSHKVMLNPLRGNDPSLEDPRFTDPRHGGEAYDSLPTMAKFAAMHEYRRFVVSWLRAPMGHSGWDNMETIAFRARKAVECHARVFKLSEEEVKGVSPSTSNQK